jgi:hypothetical protein
MNLDKFDTPLADYLKAISLNATQDARINSALVNMSAVMLAALPDAEIYAQGSYALDTLAKPLTAKQGNGKAGEYDIDIAIERGEWDSAVDALKEIARIANEHHIYGGMTIEEDHNRCVRIEYAPDDTGVSFHIDLVAIKATDDGRKVADRADDDWKPSDAKQFVEWFNGQAEQQPNLRPLIVILKRLRDLNGLNDNLKSIMTVTLVTQCYAAQGSLMGDLVALLEEVNVLFTNSTEPPAINNPVNPGEDLATGIKDYATVRQFFIDASDALDSALVEDDAEALKQLFGPGFVYVAEGAIAVAAAVAATPLQPTRAYGGYDANTDAKD